jgi:hypothetical protein
MYGTHGVGNAREAMLRVQKQREFNGRHEDKRDANEIAREQER